MWVYTMLSRRALLAQLLGPRRPTLLAAQLTQRDSGRVLLAIAGSLCYNVRRENVYVGSWLFCMRGQWTRRRQRLERPSCKTRAAMMGRWLMAIQPTALLVGLVVLVTIAIVYRGRSELAQFLFDYYNTRPDPRWRPRWLPWAFRPTRRQTELMTWMLICLGLVIGLSGIVVGLDAL